MWLNWTYTLLLLRSRYTCVPQCPSVCVWVSLSRKPTRQLKNTNTKFVCFRSKIGKIPGFGITCKGANSSQHLSPLCNAFLEKIHHLVITQTVIVAAICEKSIVLKEIQTNVVAILYISSHTQCLFSRSGKPQRCVIALLLAYGEKSNYSLHRLLYTGMFVLNTNKKE
jgi:hypothetical protein